MASSESPSKVECPLLRADPAMGDDETAASVRNTCPLAQHAMSRLSCPACGALASHRSHRRGFMDRMITYIGGQIRRCDSCATRFVRFGNSTMLIADVRKANQRTLALFLKSIIFAVGILGGIVFLVWVWTRIPGG